MSARVGLVATNQASTDWYMARLLEGGVRADALTVYPTDFEAINALLPYPSDALDDALMAILGDVREDKILLPNITLHETYDRLRHQGLDLPEAVHPYRLLGRYLSEPTELILFGSSYTMTSNYTRTWIIQQGHNMVDLPSADRLLIDEWRRSIYDHGLTQGVIDAYKTMFMHHMTSGVVVLACTELSQLGLASGLEAVDMAMLQVEEIAHI